MRASARAEAPQQTQRDRIASAQSQERACSLSDPWIALQPR